MTRAEQKAAKRARLVAVAEKAFRHQGYNEVTYRSLAQEAGVSTGGFFAFWKSKGELYRDVMGREPPDAPEFLARVAIALTGTPYQFLATEAEELRKRLIGQHS